MKIAVPIRQQEFSAHFGGAEEFALYSIDDVTRKVGQREDVVPPEHGHGVFPMWLRRQGATLVLAGSMGTRASDILARHGIAVVLGVAGNDPDRLVQDFLRGTLKTTGEVCHEHGFHDCGAHPMH